MYHPEPPHPLQKPLPTMYDLPSEDPEEPGLPDEFHISQPRLLDDTCHPPNHPSNQVFTASDLNLYYCGSSSVAVNRGGESCTPACSDSKPCWIFYLRRLSAISQ